MKAAENVIHTIYASLFLSLFLFSGTTAYGQSDASKREALIAEVDTLLGSQKFDEALPILNQVLAKSKTLSDEDYTLLYKRAYCLYALSDFENALADINRYIEKKPEEQAKLLRAYINQELGNVEAQLDDLNEFLEKNPDNLELLRWRASVLMQSDRFGEAQNDIKTLMKWQTGPELKAYLGLSYYYLDDADSAMLIFDEVIEDTPAFVQPYVYASSLALEEEAYKLALQYIEKGLEVEPDNLTLQFYKGIALVETDETDAGCRCLTKAFEGGVDDVAAYLKAYCYGVE
jgi:tetratricopeptide (TPR) repeat protein